MGGVPGINHVCLLDDQGNNTSKCAAVNPDSGSVGGMAGIPSVGPMILSTKIRGLLMAHHRQTAALWGAIL